MQDYVDKIKHLQNLKNEPADYWRNLMNKYMIDQNLVVIIGDPSEEKMEQSGKEEKERVKKQQDKLGEEGLAKKKKIVDDAIAINTVYMFYQHNQILSFRTCLVQYFWHLIGLN